MPKAEEADAGVKIVTPPAEHTADTKDRTHFQGIDEPAATAAGDAQGDEAAVEELQSVSHGAGEVADGDDTAPDNSADTLPPAAPDSAASDSLESSTVRESGFPAEDNRDEDTGAEDQDDDEDPKRLVDEEEAELDLPVVQTGRQLQLMGRDAWDALLETNVVPALFTRNGQVCRLANGRVPARLVNVDVSELKALLEDHILWKSGQKTSRPDDRLGPHMLRRPPASIRPVEHVVRVPSLMPDGRLLMEDGYHPGYRVLYEPWGQLPLPNVAGNPADHDVEQALDVLFNDYLADFPYEADADRAHHLAMLLLPFVRPLLGHALQPGWLITGENVGNGKTWAAHLYSVIATGQKLRAETPAAGEELRKKVVAAAAKGAEVIFFDNMPRGKVISSDALAAIMTAEGGWSDRRLGSSNIITSKHLPMIVITGNNLKLDGDLLRRFLMIRLKGEPSHDRRRVFRRRRLLNDVAAEPGPVFTALLTLVQAWNAAGRPAFTGQPLESFNDFSEIIGGILEVAGQHEFLQLTEVYKGVDHRWVELLEATDHWYEEFGERWTTAAGLAEEFHARNMLGSVLTGSNNRARSTSVGSYLTKLGACVLGGYKMEIQTGPSRQKYRLVRLPENDIG